MYDRPAVLWLFFATVWQPRVRVRYCSAGIVLADNCLTKEELRIVSLKDTMMGEFVYHHFKKYAFVNGLLPQWVVVITTFGAPAVVSSRHVFVGLGNAAHSHCPSPATVLFTRKVCVRARALARSEVANFQRLANIESWKLSRPRDSIKYSRTDSRMKMWKFSNISGAYDPGTSENFRTLTRLSAREDRIGFSERANWNDKLNASCKLEA